MDIKAVGIRPDGTLYGILDADPMHGHRFMKVIVSVDQTDWYKENKEVIDSTINGVDGGEVVLLFDALDEGD